MKLFAALAGLSLLLADPASALAEVRGPGENAPLNLPPSHPPQLAAGGGAGGGSLVRTLVGLAVVVGVIYGLYWVLRTVKKSREERALGSGLHTEAVVPLGPNRSLHLVRAGRELVLVGVAEQGVVPIRTYSEEEAAEAGLVAPAAGSRSADEPPVGGTGAPRPTLGALLQALRQRTVRG